MSQRNINADDLHLALAVRHSGSPVRYAAMSNGVKTNACGDRGTYWGVKHGPLFSPMDRGRIDLAIERTKVCNGTAELRRTWGAGIKALRAETASPCMRRGASQ